MGRLNRVLFDDRPRDRLRTAVDLGCAAAHPHFDLCAGRAVDATAHDRGLRVVAWKAVRTPGEVVTLRGVGVDGVTADRLDVAPEHAAGAGHAPTGREDLVADD